MDRIARANATFLETGSQQEAIRAYLREREPEPKPVSKPDPEPRISAPPSSSVLPVEKAAKARPVSRRKLLKRYKCKVWRLTEAQPLHLLDNIEKRAWRGWHLDHVLSIAEGFKRGLPPESIACLSNLRMIPFEENISKGRRTVFTDLFNATVKAGH